jgi:hypothetical protein
MAVNLVDGDKPADVYTGIATRYFVLYFDFVPNFTGIC